MASSEHGREHCMKVSAVYFMRLIYGLLFLFGGLVFSASAHPYRGIDALERIDALPILRRATSAHQVSSYERNGGNADRNSWLYREESGDYVIFDDMGAGCIYRFWMTYGGMHPDYSTYAESTYVKIYLDDDESPRFESSLANFFSGTVDPFLSPLAGNRSVSSGGYYSYIPIPYESRCRITLTDMPPASMRNLNWGTNSFWVYYNVTYHKYASADGVVSWTGSEEYGPLIDLWDNVGLDPKPSDQNIVFHGSLAVETGAVSEVVHISGGGVLNSIEFVMPALNMKQLNDLWLRIYWDDQAEAAVEAPFGQFFGSGYGETQVNGLLIGIDAGRYYCYFPMPFWQSLRMELENKGDGDIDPVVFSIGVESRDYDRESSGYFHAQHAVGEYTNYVVGSDFLMLEETGRGQYVGVTLSATGAGKYSGNGLAFLEGDERFHIDGSLTPQLHGTGNEDYFNGGWYYNGGIFSLPIHGSPVRSNPYSNQNATNYVGAYRIHIGDLVPFNSSISVGIEHGGANEVGCHLESVCYYYKQIGEGSGLTHCTTFDVGDPASEAAVGYQVSGLSNTQTNVFHYTGDAHDVAIADEGHYLAGSSFFSVSIPASNDGMLVRRRTDAGVGKQRAAVYVDDVYVSEWYFADTGFSNEVQRWADSALYLPYEYTAGKSNIVLRFDSANTNGLWNEYNYTVYAIEPMSEQADMDEDGIPDRWETAYFSDLIACVNNEDVDGDGFNNRDEFVCFTHPQDPGSYFAVESDPAQDRVLSFETVPGRVYQVLHTSSLIDGEWEELIKVPGAGEEYVIPVSGAIGERGYYRVKVRQE